MFAAGLALLLGGCAVAAPLTVAVETAAGVPRIVVNGEPVRGRVFYGGPTNVPVPLPAEGGPIVVEFTALHEEREQATMHLRFGEGAGRIVLDNLVVTELSTGRQVFATDFEDGAAGFAHRFEEWPRGADNTVAKTALVAGTGQAGTTGLVIDLSAPPGTAFWPDWHLYAPWLDLRRGERYRVSLWAQADPARELRLAFYRPGEQFVFIGGPGDHHSSQIRHAADADVPFVSFPIGTPWPRPGEEADYSAVDASCETILAANPNALLWPRLGLDAPFWWLEANPDEAMVWSGGEHVPHAVVASPVYQAAALDALDKLVRHLEARFPDSLAGYHPCGQNTGEWFYEDTWGPDLNGYAPADLAAYRAWSGDPNATVPTPEQRFAAPGGVLRDPATEANIVNFTRFQQEAMADFVCAQARVIKQATAGRKLSIIFYGYVYEFGAIATGPAISGHYALRRALDCPDIDILCSPISYHDRQQGGGGLCMTAAESVALAGKLWLVEDDTRTYLVRNTGFPGDVEGADTQADTRSLLQRNLAHELTRNMATWWMDLGSAGWYDDPVLWADMKAIEPLDQLLLDQPTAFHPQIASVVDEESALWFANRGWVASRPLIYEARAALSRLGAPFGQYLQDDLEAGRVPGELVILHNPFVTTPARRAALRRAAAGRSALWCFAPGYLEGDGHNLAAMADLTGFDVQPLAGTNTGVTTTAQGLELGATNRAWAQLNEVTPRFTVVDAQPGEVLATWADGAPAVARRRVGDGWSIFWGVPGWDLGLLRGLAREAGVHLYTDTLCHIYANGPVLGLHAVADGPVMITLPRAARVRDALTGDAVADGTSFELDLKLGDTRIYRLD